ncbi:MAG: hypothetical protein NW237_15325 [Cyanobacteriota bacterium]|nr:hypothetical protein [Cyanobacteriota bacterium]
MEIKTDDYYVYYDAEAGTVVCQGSLRLAGTEEYAPVAQLLGDAADQQQESLKLDLRDLQFLNSSGINMLSKFVLKIRQQGSLKIIVQGSKLIPWQGKSLKNLQRLLPSMILELE